MNLSRIFLRTILVVFLLSFSILQVLPQLDNHPLTADDSMYPYVILETRAPVREVLELLSPVSDGIIWRENAQLPLSRVGNHGLVGLASLNSRLEEGDIRRSPGLELLESRFHREASGGQLIFIPRAYGSSGIEQLLSPLKSSVFLHIDRGLPPFFGAGIWALVTFALLVFADQRVWTLIAAFCLLPLFFVSNPLFLSLSCILFVLLRDAAWRMYDNYCREVQQSIEGEQAREASILLFPSTPGEAVGLLRLQASAAAPFRGLWFALVLAAQLAALIIAVQIIGILCFLQIFVFFAILLLRMYSFLQFSRQQEHSLFFASGLTPAWDKPPRSERAALWFVMILVALVPYLFRLNYSPFPGSFLRAEQLGTAEDTESLDALLDQVKSRLESRIQGESEEMPEAAPLVLLLSDRAYQQAFPHLSLVGKDGAGRYSEGRVMLTRYRRQGDGLESYEETVLEINRDWLLTELESNGSYDMIRLYSDGESWYDIRSETGIHVLPRMWSLIPEMLVIAVLALPWLGRWQFEPLRRLADAFRKSGKRGYH